MLASGNVTVTTTGSGVQATNIHVNARLGWSAATTLVLDAYRSIELNSKVTVAGTGGVSLTTNDGGSGGEFACENNGRVTFASLSSALMIDGRPYVLVNSVSSLASAIAANPSGAFALAKNYNAKKDGTYASAPVSTVFSGSFDGLGNTISNLSINDPTEEASVGLFAETGASSTLSNIRLVNESVQGWFVGGLVGGVEFSWAKSATITHSFNSGTVSGLIAGGLLGGGSGVVASSGSTATVSGGQVGGLIAVMNSGSISDSWATGNVSGDNFFVGGLVGYEQSGVIKHSWASGQVSGTYDASTGGLVGVDDWGLIEKSYASGAVSCTFNCGGLVGWEGMNDAGTPKVLQSYATGTVTADPTTYWCSGALVGRKTIGDILNSYASGAVTANCAGGLLGENDDGPYRSISSSYATGAVNGTKWGGGLIGYGGFGSKVKHTFWDMTTSGITDPSQGAGNIANDPGIKGLSDKKLKSGLPSGFDPKIWNEDSTINNGLPYLINNPPPK
jgi:hypothetical protein